MVRALGHRDGLVGDNERAALLCWLHSQAYLKSGMVGLGCFQFTYWHMVDRFECAAKIVPG